MRNSFADQFITLARLDPRLILITGDLGFGVLDQIATELPNQYINAGITEQSMMSMAAGLASEGYRPFVYSIANFPTLRCLEQIRNDVCYMDNPVTIVAVGAGLGYGNLGYTHHAVEDIAIMRTLPNLSIYSPADSTEVRKCMSHILENNSPAYMRLGKGGEPAIHSGDLSSVIDPIQVTQGNNGFIAFTGGVGSRVLEAEKILNSEGFYPTIFSNPRLSSESIKSLINSARDSFLLTVEEHSLKGGFGSWLLEAKADLNSNVKISRLGLNQENISLLGSQAYLLDTADITARGIADKFIDLAEYL